MSETFGQWLKSRREERGMTLRDVERVTEGRVSNAALSQIETGKTRSPGFTQIVQIAAAYGLMINDVVERARTGNDPPPTPDFCPHCGQLMRAES
jgi:transcriptional regulator with XRE-family HTH domain